MGLSDRARRKGAASAQQLLPEGATVREYVVGRAHARMTTGAVVAGVIFCAAFIVALAFGTILIPGGLLLIYVIQATRPPRAVVVADQGVGVLNRSFLNARPTKVLALLPADAARQPTAAGRTVTLHLGVDRVTFAKREYERLAACLGRAPQSHLQYPPPAPAAY